MSLGQDRMFQRSQTRSELHKELEEGSFLFPSKQTHFALWVTRLNLGTYILLTQDD